MEMLIPDNYVLEQFVSLAKVHYIEMTIFWIICLVLQNGSFVDFGWPLGFFCSALYYLNIGEGWFYRKLFICIPYLLCSFRFMFGWLVGRKHHLREDKRWALWRERWKNGEGWFGIKSIPLNFFFFYHSQSTYNVFFVSFPLILMTKNTTEYFYPVEIIGMFLWFLSFVIENSADVQLSNWARRYKKKKLTEVNVSMVCKDGLWYYSRHPNYFGEFLLWVSYCLMATASVYHITHFVFLFMMFFGAYYFLVHFTGAWMAEQSSVKRRGKEYTDYQDSTNMIIPWFPRKLKSS